MTIDNETLLLLNAYHDGELSPIEALSMERRIKAEPELAAFTRQLDELSSGLSAILPGDPASSRLRASILASITTDLTQDDVSNEPEPEISLQSADPRRAYWGPIAAALAIGLVGGGFAGGYFTHLAQTETRAATIENEILTAHLRGLIAPQPFDIASSESHVVKPWFNGKTTIAPTTPDFSAQGFPLIGGRVDVIDRKPVPVMIYKRRQHTISVTVTTSSDVALPAQSVIDGTNVTSWTDGNLTYSAVSDLNLGELSSFADLYRKRLAGGG